jgi:hypothetical protein
VPFDVGGRQVATLTLDPKALFGALSNDGLETPQASTVAEICDKVANRDAFGAWLRDLVWNEELDAWLASNKARLCQHKPEYATTGARGLTPACRKLLRSVDLHFHDLRREAGSRWLDGGVPLQVIRDWLGHANISQTSTYLESTFAGQHEAMRAFEQRLQRIATPGATGDQNPPPDATIANSATLETTAKHH